MKKILFYLILITSTFQIACSQNKGQVTVKQVPSSYPIRLKANLEKDAIILVKFYPTFDISNNTDEEVRLSYPEYIYKGKFLTEYFKGLRTLIPVYFKQNDSMKNVLGNKDLEKLEKKSKQYVFATGHELSKDSSVQSFFSSYLEKMKKENKDTLHVGTITELKEKNSPILQLLEGDSIVISFGRNDLYMEPIPVQIK